MKRKDLRLYPGGLMRCCTHSASEWVTEAPDKDVEEGEPIACRYEHRDTMYVQGDGVRWLHSAEESGQ